MAKNIKYFTPALQNLAFQLNAIPTRGNSVSWSFPAGWKPANVERFTPGEELSAYFTRTIDQGLAGKPWPLEEKSLVLIELEYNSGYLTALSIEAFLTSDATIKEYYQDPTEGPLNYFRYDYHPSHRKGPGRLFNETQPHLHTRPRHEPRISLGPAPDGNLIGQFFDFLYRNYFYDDWSAWAREHWSEHPNTKINQWPPELFDKIARAYKKNGLAALKSLSLLPQYQLLRQILIDELDKQFPAPRAEPAKVRLLNL